VPFPAARASAAVTASTSNDVQPSLRSRVSDLFEPDPAIYWADFLVHAVVGWCALALAVAASGWTAVAAAAAASFALYRAVIFTHELVHLRQGSLPGFRSAWDAICGVPLMVPSFLYDGVHQEHHFRHHYGTPQDGEYLPFGHPPRWMIPLYLAGHVVIPPLAVLRFGVIAPLSWIVPPIRRHVLERMSSLSIDPAYRRRLPGPIPSAWLAQEAACAAFVWTVAAALWAGWLPLRLLAVWYVVAVSVLVLNGVRTLAAHRYANITGTMTREEQLLDSVNIAGRSPLTPLLAPVGLRYHALHHLFPTMPYHHLGEAHRRLMRVLPEDAPYRATVQNGFVPALADLWRRAGETERPVAADRTF